jgi:hypothetical protein
MMSPDRLNSNCDAHPPDIQHTFSAIVSQFLAQRCTFGAGFHIADRELFPQFRAFWMATTSPKDHPALLGHYRVVLTEMGYRSHGGKDPAGMVSHCASTRRGNIRHQRISRQSEDLHREIYEGLKEPCVF